MNDDTRKNISAFFEKYGNGADYFYVLECMIKSRKADFDFYKDFDYAEFDPSVYEEVGLGFTNGNYPFGFTTPKNDNARKELAYALFFISYHQLNDKRTMVKVYNYYKKHADQYKDAILQDAEEKIYMLFDNPYFESDHVTLQRFANALIISQLYLNRDFTFLQSLTPAVESGLGPAWAGLFHYVYTAIINEDEIATDFLFTTLLLAHNHEQKVTYAAECAGIYNSLFQQTDANDTQNAILQSSLYQYLNCTMLHGNYTPSHIHLTNGERTVLFWINQKLENNKTVTKSQKLIEYMYAAGTIETRQQTVRNMILDALPDYLSVSIVEVQMPDIQAKMQLKQKDEEIARLKELLNKKQTVINRLDKENAKYRADQVKTESPSTEVATEQTKTVAKPQITEESFDVEQILAYIKDKKYVMIGGYDKGQGINQYLPNMRIVEAENRNAPKFDMSGYDMLLVRANCVKHSTTNKYINMARSTKTPILYIGENDILSMRQIYDALYQAS